MDNSEYIGCKNRGMKYERDGKYLCKNCARRYDGKSPIESDEELKERQNTGENEYGD